MAGLPSSIPCVKGSGRPCSDKGPELRVERRRDSFHPGRCFDGVGKRFAFFGFADQVDPGDVNEPSEIVALPALFPADDRVS